MSLKRVDSLPDDNTDLNVLTDEQHDHRMVASLSDSGRSRPWK